MIKAFATLNALVSSIGASMVGFIQAAAGAVLRTVQFRLRLSCYVEDFGATGDGTTDDSAAFILAGAAGFKEIHAHGTYRIGASIIELAGGQTWQLQGARFNTTSTTATLFRAGQIDDWAMLGPFTITGTGSGATSGTAKGIYVVGCNRWRVENPILNSIQGWGIYVLPGAGPSGTVRGDQGHIVNPQILYSWIGIEFGTDPGCEYCTLTAPMIGGCAWGAIIPAGNVIVQGGNIVDNVGDGGGGGGGLYITGGNNNAHGIINGVNINHNTPYNLVCRDVTNGETFADCHFYGNVAGTGQGAIWLDNCKGINLQGGFLDCWIYNDSGATSGYNYVRGMYCPGSYGDVTITSTNGDEKHCIVMDCWGAGAYTSGVTINDPNPVFVLAERVSGSTQALTSGAAAAALIFNTEVFDRRVAYDNTTGVFTVPTAQDGVYEIQACCEFAGTAISATASYIDLKVNGTAKTLFGPTIYSTTNLTINVSRTLRLAAGDTVTLAASITTGAGNPTFGDATYTSSLRIERIA